MFARYRPGSAAGLVAGDFEVGQLLAARREDQDPPLFLVEVRLEMGPAGARRDLLHDRQVRFSLELALDDQVASPGLEPEGPLDRVLLVIHAQGEDEVRLGPPGDLELDAGASREVRSRLGSMRRRVGQSVGPKSSRQFFWPAGSFQPTRPFGPR